MASRLGLQESTWWAYYHPEQVDKVSPAFERSNAGSRCSRSMQSASAIPCRMIGDDVLWFSKSASVTNTRKQKGLELWSSLSIRR